MSFGKGFFTRAFNEENSVEQPEGTPVEEVKEEMPVAEEKKEEVETTPTDEVKDEPVLPQTFEIDGEEFSLEQIKEFKKGYMRQSDYTKKTQELARQRKDLEEKGINPESDDSPELQRIKKLELDLESKRLDEEVNALKGKYGDIDEVALFNECEKRGIYNDLEFVYKGMINEQPKEQVDIETIKQQAIEEFKRTQQQIEADKIATSGSIIGNEGGSPPVDYSELLSESERSYCQKRGYSHKEYYDMINADYKI